MVRKPTRMNGGDGRASDPEILKLNIPQRADLHFLALGESSTHKATGDTGIFSAIYKTINEGTRETVFTALAKDLKLVLRTYVSVTPVPRNQKPLLISPGTHTHVQILLHGYTKNTF